MTIVKLALIGFLRIAFFGSLKVALCAYTLSQQAPIPNNRRSKS